MAKKKTTAVGKTAKPAKTPTPTRQKLQHEINSLHREVNSLKHGAPARKHKTAHAKHKTKTGLALAPGEVACCAAQALAASLRLALGVAVHDEDMLALYWRTAGDPDEGASVLDTLRAAWESGLAGTRPAWFGPVTGQRRQRVIDAGNGAAAGAERLKIGAALDWDLADIPHLAAFAPAENRQPRVELGRCRDLPGIHGLILELELPGGPHAVVAAPDGTWWSWGEPYSPEDFAGAVLSEAWAVRWQ